MIRSMTGYAAVSAQTPRGTLALEMRTVNSRFLDIQFRVAEEMRSAEPLLRELITARVSRGKVDCRLSLDEGEGAGPKRLNAEALAQLQQLAGEVKRSMPEAGALRVADVLRWPGILAEATLDEAATRAAVEGLARRALDELCAAREREGGKLATIILQRVAEMQRLAKEAAPLVPEALAAWRTRVAERLREAQAVVDEERLRAELAVQAARSDVDEELTRLGAHLVEVERVLAEGGARGSPVGKRLDFLAQELNREANTLASKATGLKLADCALELKLLIEQVREQVQNIE
jgi:uncharacterized protein (TIGR00255 family)